MCEVSKIDTRKVWIAWAIFTKFENGFGTVEQQIVEDDSDRFKKSLVGGVIGFRYDFNNQVGINGRYALDFQKNNENGSSTTPEFKNQVFQIGLGVKF